MKEGFSRSAVAVELAKIWAEVAAFAAARPATSAAAATLVLSLAALAWPGIDLAVSRLFYHPGDGFPAERVAALIAFRNLGRSVTALVTVGLVAAWVGKLVLPMLMRAVSSRRLLFLTASLAIGPGLLVNAFLKEVWDRARPRDVVEFGGTLHFFPAWVPGGGCDTNCSFPSGEASGAMWLVAFAFVVPAAWRRPVAVAALAWALAISANRLIFGGHFLSDVLIGWGLTLTVVFAAHFVLVERVGPSSEARLDAWLGRIGERGLDGFRAGLAAVFGRR